MDEENVVKKIRKSYDSYIKVTDDKIDKLESLNKKVSHKLAFYIFEYHLIRGTLYDKIKEVYDMQNVGDTRLTELMNMKNKEFEFKDLPAEIKMVVKEMIL